MRSKVMITKERAKQILENVNASTKKLDELTTAVVGFCIRNTESKSMKNLVEFIRKFETTQYLLNKFIISDVREIIHDNDLIDFQNWLMDCNPELLFDLFYRMVYLVRYIDLNNGVIWYKTSDEILNRFETGKECIFGHIGKTQNIDIYACGFVVNEENEIITKIRRLHNKSKIYIKVSSTENNNKKFIISEVR